MTISPVNRLGRFYHFLPNPPVGWTGIPFQGMPFFNKPSLAKGSFCTFFTMLANSVKSIYFFFPQRKCEFGHL